MIHSAVFVLGFIACNPRAWVKGRKNLLFVNKKKQKNFVN